jgi:hypothetical protein
MPDRWLRSFDGLVGGRSAKPVMVLRRLQSFIESTEVEVLAN